MLAIALEWVVYWLNCLELMRVLALVFAVSTLFLLLVVLACMRDYNELSDRHERLNYKLGAMVRKINQLAQERDAARMHLASMRQSMPANSNGGPPINNFQGKEDPVNFPKNLDEVQESLKKGGRIMSKMRKNKSLIREVGFLRAVMMFGLVYVLASMVRETWDRIKYRFDEDAEGDGKSKQNQEWEE